MKPFLYLVDWKNICQIRQISIDKWKYIWYTNSEERKECHYESVDLDRPRGVIGTGDYLLLNSRRNKQVRSVRRANSGRVQALLQV